RPAKRAASEVLENPLGVGLWVLRNHLDTFAEVVDGRWTSRQVAEDPAMTLRRPGFVQRPFHIDVLHRQPWPVPLVRPNLVDGVGPGQPVGKYRNARSRLEVPDKLEDCRLVGRGVEVADQPVFPAQLTIRHPEGDRLVRALKARGGDLDAV